MSNIQKYEADLEALVTLGEKMAEDLVIRHKKGENSAKEGTVCLEANYQDWYTESSVVIGQILPGSTDRV